MALKGSLKDFNLTNILQMISVEKKTGTLDVSRDKKNIRLSFVEGRAVSAERGLETDERYIKQSFVANNYIKENDWSKIYAEREKSLKPLFSVLKRYVRPEILSSYLNKQIKDGVFELLSWEDGKYEFTPQKILFDSDIVSPLDVEFLLMEGCRVVDEMKELDKEFPPGGKLMKKNILDSTKSSSSDLNKGDKTELEMDILKKKGIELSENEKKILSAMDEQTSIENILCSSMLEEFETRKTIVKFLSLKIIIPSTKRRVKGTIEKSGKTFSFYKAMDKIFKVTSLGILILFNVWGILNWYHNLSAHLGERKKGITALREYITKAELFEIQNSISEYFTVKGRYPDTIGDIVHNGLLSKKHLTDSWGRPYIYTALPKKKSFSLFSSGEDEKDTLDDIVY